MMTLSEGLAGHCLTVIGFLLQPWGEEEMEGKRSKEKREWGKSRQERERERERDLRERETTVFYGDQSSKPHCPGQLYRIYWTVPHYPAPHPIQLLSSLSSFSCSPPFRFPTRQAFSRTLERCKSNTMSTSAFYPNTFYAHRHLCKKKKLRSIISKKDLSIHCSKECAKISLATQKTKVCFAQRT